MSKKGWGLGHILSMSLLDIAYSFYAKETVETHREDSMAKVYTGKALIPGDKMNVYLKLMQEAEEKREPFSRQLTELNKQFHKFFSFLAAEKGIVNEKVLKVLQ